jgi:hypothetical protein
MTKTNLWRRIAAVAAASAALTLAGLQHATCILGERAAFFPGRHRRVHPDADRTERPECRRAIGGALVGGGLGSLIGGGTGKTVATVVGAIGGGFVGNELASKDQTLVWDIGVRYDNGTYATVQQTSAPGLRIGDRVSRHADRHRTLAIARKRTQACNNERAREGTTTTRERRDEDIDEAALRGRHDRRDGDRFHCQRQCARATSKSWSTRRRRRSTISCAIRK